VHTVMSEEPGATPRPRPLILLIGGMAGSGKSSIATELAHRLGIVRIQPTDMLREVMRMMIAEPLLPPLHTSSFLAWQSLPGPHGETPTLEHRLVDGYRAQSEPVMAGCRAVLARALKERVSMIVEGVHMLPGFHRRLPPGVDATVVPVVLAVPDREQLRARFRGRGETAPDRRARRYLEHLEAIWQIQRYLLAEAARHGVPVVENDDWEAAVARILALVEAAQAR